MTAAAAPGLSVVVPSVNGWSDLEGCLRALQAQRDATVEIIVADRLGAAVRGPLRAAFPGVRLVEAAPDTTIPALRRMAFAQASAPVVGVIEDHVIVPPDWARRMLDAHAAGAEVVGGAVENAATGNLVDWSAFLCEYSHCLEPQAGASSWLTGNNTTYRRALLERFAPVIAEERWEGALHDAIRDAGIELLSRPDIVVGHKRHYTALEYVQQRYLYSRSYAGLRVAGAGAARRAAYGAAALALPPVLFGRVVSRVWRSGRHRGQLLKSIPLLAVYVVGWALGETAGAWFGPGNALQRVN